MKKTYRMQRGIISFSLIGFFLFSWLFFYKYYQLVIAKRITGDERTADKTNAINLIIRFQKGMQVRQDEFRIISYRIVIKLIKMLVCLL